MRMPWLSSFGVLGASVKSTLAFASIQKLHSSLEKFKFSNVVFDNTIDNGRPRHIAKLQEQIVNNLTGQKDKFGNPRSGRSRLKEILQCTSSFVFIDNVENADDVRELLPRELSLEDGVIPRILIASREREFRSQIPRNCKLKSYQMQPLSPEHRFDLLKKELLDSDSDNYIESFDGETRKLSEIAELCGGIPLLLKVIAMQLQEDRCLDSYEEIIEKLEDGKLLQESYYEKANSVLSFMFKKLSSDLQHDFVELCVYFFDGYLPEWDEVCKLVGQRQMKALMRKGLISTGENSEVVVHDILRKMALNEGRKLYILNKHEWDDASKNAELKTVEEIKISEYFTKAVVEAKQLDSICESLQLLSLEGDTNVLGQCQHAFNHLRYLRLELHTNTVEAFPFKDIRSFINLRYLFLGYQSIEIPLEIWSLPSLSYLSKGFKCMPEHIGRLKKLKELIIAECPITKLPQNFSSLTSLEECVIDGTELERLPSDFGHGLSSLKTLILNSNPLRCLPGDEESLYSRNAELNFEGHIFDYVIGMS